jgi:uncharacterized protein YodC (DUF2158 family)
LLAATPSSSVPPTATGAIEMANATKFNVGDTVKLKSGGPDMSVKSIPDAPHTTYVCQWFAGKKLEQGAFPADSLEKVK